MGSHANQLALQLKDRRTQRGMTQQEVAEALERLAWVQHARRVGVNADMVSKWERGQKRPSRFYTRLLCSLFQVTPAQLGYPVSVGAPTPMTAVPEGNAVVELLAAYEAVDGADAAMELLRTKLLELWRDEVLDRRKMLKLMGAVPAVGALGPIDSVLGPASNHPAPARLGDQTLTHLGNLTRQMESRYHVSDPRRLLLPLRALIGTAEDVLPQLHDQGARRPLLGILARANLLAGRLSFFDLHEHLPARAYLDLAREAAQQSHDPITTAVVFGHMAFLPAAKLNFSAGAAYLSAARDALARQPVPLVSAWLCAVESELSTRAGLSKAAFGCLSKANAEMAQSRSAPVPTWFDFFDEKRLNGFEGFALRRAGDIGAARRKLEAALAPSATVGPKQRAVSMVDLAVTCVGAGDIDEGCRLASEAATDLHHAGYATAVDRLIEFQSALPDQRHPAARFIRESIAELS